MAVCNLNAHITLRRDNLENWENTNPILLEGEPGIGIDKETGKCVLKIGDGVHSWKELSLELGRAATSCAQMANLMQQFTDNIKHIKVPSGAYKTLNPQHEIL